MANYTKIKQYMIENVDGFTEIDPDTEIWEVKSTLLAEDACDFFFDYAPNGEVPQIYYDTAYEVGIAKEKELNRRK